MEWVTIVASLALLEYLVFVFRAGRARGRHSVAAPATTGHPDFERNLRVQENTIEQLVVFLPMLFAFAYFVSEAIAAVVGVLFILGRALYARAYVSDPARRGPGFLLTLVSNFVLTLGSLIGAIVALF
jgi:glutathione S-transferase